MAEIDEMEGEGLLEDVVAIENAEENASYGRNPVWQHFDVDLDKKKFTCKHCKGTAFKYTTRCPIASTAETHLKVNEVFL